MKSWKYDINVDLRPCQTDTEEEQQFALEDSDKWFTRGVQERS